MARRRHVSDTALPWGVAAMSIRSLVAPGEFDPEALEAMVEAFDAAYKALDDSGQPKIVLEVIAQRIIEAARCGERDPARLVKAALPWLTGE
jgi:hypothetical protein